MRAPDADNLLLGRGKLYFDRFDASGDPTGEEDLGNCTNVSIQTEDEKREKFSSQVATSVQLKSVVVQRNVTVRITADEFAIYNIAMHVMGEQSDYTQTQGVINGEVLTTSVVQGRWYPTAKRRINNVQIAGKVEGTDFEVDSISGRVRAIVGGSIADGASLTLTSYDHDAADIDRVLGASKNTIEGRLRFIGDPAAGPKYEAIFHKVSIAPDGELGLITDDYGNMTFVMDVIKHDDHTDLYQVLDITAETEYTPT